MLKVEMRSRDAVISSRLLPALLLLVLIACSAQAERQKRSASPIYGNEFAVHVPSGAEAADAIAVKHGFVNMGQVGQNSFLLMLIHLKDLVFTY